MTLILQLSNPENLPEDLRTRQIEFGIGGGLIGRGKHCDWVLTDAQKFVSNEHAHIYFDDGYFFVKDLSTNGTYLNDVLVGKGQEKKLSTNDVLCIGSFIVTVENRQRVTDLGSSNANFTLGEIGPAGNELLKSSDENATASLLYSESNNERVLERRATPSPESGQIPKNWWSENPKQDAVTLFEDTQEAPNETENTSKSQSNKNVEDNAVEFTSNFFQALGVECDGVNLLLGEQFGLMLKEFLDGVGDLAAARNSMRTELRLSQTIVGTHGNNPLKFSESSTDALKKLTIGEAGGFLSPSDAAREVMFDLRDHELATLAAVEAGAFALLNALDPDKVTSGKKFASLSRGVTDMKEKHKSIKESMNERTRSVFWQKFTEVYEKTSDQSKRQRDR